MSALMPQFERKIVEGGKKHEIFSIFRVVHSLPNDKILDWSKLKAFADATVKFAKMMIFVFDRVENIVGKGENAGYQHFLLFPKCFFFFSKGC